MTFITNVMTAMTFITNVIAILRFGSTRPYKRALAMDVSVYRQAAVVLKSWCFYLLNIVPLVQNILRRDKTASAEIEILVHIQSKTS